MGGDGEHGVRDAVVPRHVGGRGTCGPASQCHGPPPKSGGLRQAVLAITWQSSPSNGSTTVRMRGWPTAAWATAAAVEQLVAELGPVGATALGGPRANTASTSASTHVDLGAGEHAREQRVAVPLELRRGLGGLPLEEPQVLADAPDHEPTVPWPAMARANDFDVIVIGGGHNGLVAAGLLAKRGARVTVLERRDVVGGAAITEQPWGPTSR